MKKITKREYMPHQKKVASWIKDKNRIGLFLEMRLGKTLVAIRWVLGKLSKKKYKILIVAPLTVLDGWEKELLLEGVSLEDIYYLEGNEEKRTEIAKSINKGWLLVNYERLRVTPKVFKMSWDFVILDESTFVRSPKASITKLCSTKFEHVKHKAILTGLPNPESDMDFYCQLKFLHDEFMGKPNYWQWRHSYFQQFGYDWYPRKNVRKKIKEELSKSCYTLSRKQAGLGEKKIYEKRYIAMNSVQKKAYKEVGSDFSFEDILTKWVPVKFNWYARIAGGFNPRKEVISKDKTKEIGNLLKGELKDQQVVIWFRFTKEINLVYEYLKNELNIPTVFINGLTKPKIRKTRINNFQKGLAQVICCQTKIAPFGLDFSCASTAIYYSNYYDFELRAQSEDRLIHPKKKEPLLYIDLITKNTVDEDIIEDLLEKKIRSKSMLVKNQMKRGVR